VSLPGAMNPRKEFTTILISSFYSLGNRYPRHHILAVVFITSIIELIDETKQDWKTPGSD
jgi:hypothetical protein